MIKGSYGDDNPEQHQLKHAEVQYLDHSVEEIAHECRQQSKNCLHGIFNAENLNTNFRKLDQYY
jgi:DNA uptake protein ComE-like DNA-binding protein